MSRQLYPIPSLDESDTSTATLHRPSFPLTSCSSRSKRESDKHWESSESLQLASSDASDVHMFPKSQTTTKSPPRSDMADNQAPFLSPHAYRSSNNSKPPSRRTSFSSLQALDEDNVVDARSDSRPPSRTSFTQRMSQKLAFSSDARASRAENESASQDYPVYPNQSYAMLQSQIHPTYQHPNLRNRSSFPSRIDTRSWFFPSRLSRTAANTPVSSPGLFSFKPPAPPTSSGLYNQNRTGSPYLHPTHLQPPKE